MIFKFVFSELKNLSFQDKLKNATIPQINNIISCNKYKNKIGYQNSGFVFGIQE